MKTQSEIMKTPFFTVVIPTHNREELLKEAIQSVLNQTLKNYELIVVDDHSTDKTKDVVTSFQDERIKYIVNDHTKGGAGTRNAGILRAKGEWVAFLDDDDVWFSKKLELHYKKIQEVDNNVGLVYSGYAVYDFGKKQEVSTFVPEKEGWVQKDLLYKNYIGTFSTVAIRSNLLKKVGGLDERFQGMQDMELYVRIANLAKIACVKKKIVYVSHSNKDRISINWCKKVEGSILFWEKYSKLINKDPKLRHHTASRVFMFALRQENWQILFKALPWTVAGIFFDPPHMFRVVWGVLLFFCKRKSK